MGYEGQVQRWEMRIWRGMGMEMGKGGFWGERGKGVGI